MYKLCNGNILTLNEHNSRPYSRAGNPKKGHSLVAHYVTVRLAYRYTILNPHLYNHRLTSCATRVIKGVNWSDERPYIIICIDFILRWYCRTYGGQYSWTSGYEVIIQANINQSLNNNSVPMGSSIWTYCPPFSNYQIWYFKVLVGRKNYVIQSTEPPLASRLLLGFLDGFFVRGQMLA